MLCNLDDFTGSEIIMKLKVYVVYSIHGRSQMSYALNLQDHEGIQKDIAVKTNISVF